MSANDCRPIPARETKIARFIARLIAKTGITPNQISILSMACAAMAGWPSAKARWGWFKASPWRLCLFCCDCSATC